MRFPYSNNFVSRVFTVVSFLSAGLCHTQVKLISQIKSVCICCIGTFEHLQLTLVSRPRCRWTSSNSCHERCCFNILKLNIHVFFLWYFLGEKKFSKQCANSSITRRSNRKDGTNLKRHQWEFGFVFCFFFNFLLKCNNVRTHKKITNSLCILLFNWNIATSELLV